jgi:hypothetical protein
VRRLLRWTFSFSPAVSAALFVGVCALWVCDVPPGRGALRLSGAVRVGVFGSPASAYNQPLPYTGSVIGVTPAGQTPSDPVASALDFAGVYYRHFRWRSGRTVWTLTVPTAYLAGAALVLPFAWLRCRMRERVTGGVRAGCGFDLRTAPARRAECGTGPPSKG